MLKKSEPTKKQSAPLEKEQKVNPAIIENECFMMFEDEENIPPARIAYIPSKATLSYGCAANMCAEA